jgi:hypothetical protein
MHIPNGEKTVRGSRASHEHVAKKVRSNGTSKTRGQDSDTNGHYGTTQTNGHPSKANEVQTSLPLNIALDAVLNTILTAWVILMRRYQRDVFHQFTWGTSGSDETQCISASSLSMMSVETVGSLKTRVSEVRSKNISTGRATVTMNDGTKEEVHHLDSIGIFRD